LKDADGVDPYSVVWEWFADELPVGTGDSLLLSLKHINEPLVLKASFTDGFGQQEVLHTLLGDVANRPDAATGSIWIKIDPDQPLEQGATLIAEHGLEDLDFPGGTPEDAAIEWTWYALWPTDQAGGPGREIPIGTGNRLTLTQSQVGSEIELRASFTDPWGGNEGPFTARAFGVVADRDDDPVSALVINGSGRVGQFLTLIGDVADLDSATPQWPEGLLPLAALEDLEIVWQSRAPDVAPGEPDVFQTLLAGSETELLLDASLLGHQLRAQVSWTDGGGFRETITTEAIGPVLPELATLAGQIYHWRSHALMGGVEVSLEPLHPGAPEHPEASAPSPMRTSADGGFQFEGLTFGAYQLAASRAIGGGELAAAITSADAMAALKLALGRNPNPDPDGPGPLKPLPISPYQWIAADLDADGKVTRADAQEILRIAQGQPVAAGASPAWVLIDESADLSALSGAASAAPAISSTIEVSRVAEIRNRVAILRGDVDGSWIAPPDSRTLNPDHFEALAAAHPGIITLAQFGLGPVLPV